MKNLTNLLKLSFFIGLIIAAPWTPFMAVLFGTMLLLALFTERNSFVVGVFKADVGPDISQISKYAVNLKVQLIRAFYNSLDIANDITMQPNVKNKMPLPLLIINGKPRPYTGNHMPNAGDIGYSDRELVVDSFQRDFSIDPRKYRNTYLAQFRPAGEGASKNVIPFSQFTLETAIGENAAVLNNTTAFFGLGKAAFADFNSATTYAVGDKVKFTGADGEPHYFIANAITTAAQSPATHPAKWDNKDELAITEGLGTKVKAGRTAGDIVAASTGVITSTDGFKQALEVYRKLREPLRNQANDIYLYGSSDSWDKIEDSFGDNIQKYTKADGTLSVLPRTDGKCKVKRASWMAGSGMLIASTKSNLFMGTDLVSDLSDLVVIPDVYHLKMGLTGLLGFQYSDKNAIVTNDQN